VACRIQKLYLKCICILKYTKISIVRPIGDSVKLNLKENLQCWCLQMLYEKAQVASFGMLTNHHQTFFYQVQSSENNTP